MYLCITSVDDLVNRDDTPSVSQKVCALLLCHDMPVMTIAFCLYLSLSLEHLWCLNVQLIISIGQSPDWSIQLTCIVLLDLS